MSKVDNMFLKIINDERLASTFDIVPSKYRSLDDGKRAVNPYVKAIADIIDELNININKVKEDMIIRNKLGPVVMEDADFQPIYKKVLSLLTK